MSYEPDRGADFTGRQVRDLQAKTFPSVDELIRSARQLRGRLNSTLLLSIDQVRRYAVLSGALCLWKKTATLHIVATLEALCMKYRRPEKPEERLDPTPGSNFHGAFSIRILPAPKEGGVK